MADRHIVDAGGGVEIQGAETSEPWTLDIDCMLVSHGASGFGRLGDSLRRRYPAIPFDSVDARTITSTRPHVLEITAEMISDAPTLRWLVLVNVREDALGSAEGAASLAAVRRATLAGLRMAVQTGATRVGLPLLGTGVLRLDRADVVVTLMAAVEEFATGDPGRVKSIVVFDHSAEIVDLLASNVVDRHPENEPSTPASDWGFVVSIETLGSQGSPGAGVLIDPSIVLTSAVVADPRIPFFAVGGAAISGQAEVVGQVPVPEVTSESLVVLRLLEPATVGIPAFSQIGGGDRCQIVSPTPDGVVSFDGTVAFGSDGRMYVDLDAGGRTGLVQSGSPVMVAGRVGGVALSVEPGASRVLIVPLTDVAGALGEWTGGVRDAVWPVSNTGSPPSSTAPTPPTSETPTEVSVGNGPLTEQAARILARAREVADARSTDETQAIDVVLAAMLEAGSTGGTHSATAIYACVPETPPREERLRDALRLVGVPDGRFEVGTSLAPPVDPPEDLIERASTLIGQATRVAAATTGGSLVHQRHLIAAALAGDVIPGSMTAVLGVDGSTLRRAARAYVAERWTGEPADQWDRALAEPTLDLIHRFDGDRVLTWTRRHEAERDPLVPERIADNLNVRVYATMLATLIARRSTSDSLSIGLFGEWGSGKTTFMELIQQEVDRLTAVARSTPPAQRSDFVTDVVPIWFNAWHYADANLWASLAAELFDQLLGPRPDLTVERQDALKKDLEQGQRRAEELRLASESAERRAGELRAKLIEAERVRAATRGRFDAAVLKQIVQNGTVRAELERAADAARLDKTKLEPITTLARGVAGAVDDADAIRKVLRQRRWTPVFVVALGGLLVLASAVAFSGRVRSVLGGVSLASIAVVAGQIGLAVKGAGAALAPLRRAAEQADAIEATIDLGEHDQVLADAVVTAEGTAAVLAAQLDQTLASVAAIEVRLKELSPGSRLYSFLAARAASNDYRSQLGVVSTIRRDFEELSTLMAQWRRTKSSGAEDAEAKRPIDRIVLYIDDLDRCEPDQVVAVLQAVNLLVAMDLFIVIVGVDPRWLLRSLRSRYDKLLGSSSSQDAGELSFKDATPQNYLEKIFQVPFVLPGLGAEGLGQLFTALARGGAPPDDTTLRAGGAATADRTAPRAVAATAVGEIERAPRAAPNAASPRQAAPIGVEQASEVAAIDLAPEAVTVSRDVTSDELALLARLHPLIRTPRSAKRLLNIYRLLRSTRDLRPAARFLGSDGQPGEYQAVAILLAVLTAHPELLGSMLWGQRPDGTPHPGTLCNGGGAAGWRAFVCGLRPRAPEPPGDVQDTPTAPAAPRWCNDVVDDIEQAAVHSWNDLVDALELINGEADRPFVSLDDIEPFRLWGPRVARFSFVLSAFATEAPTASAGSAGRAPSSS